MSPFIKLYVYNRLRKEKLKEPDFNGILDKELQRFRDWSGKIYFAWLWSAGGHVPNASATIPGVILLNAEWAARIVLDKSKAEMHDAFAMTVCHEMIHQENDFSYVDFLSADGKFVNWVNEVHADFGGIFKGLDGDCLRAVEAMKYKISCKGGRDKDSRSHPSWNRRMEYVMNYDFDEKLIEKIASDCCCSNERLITAVKGHFASINLKGGH